MNWRFVLRDSAAVPFLAGLVRLFERKEPGGRSAFLDGRGQGREGFSGIRNDTYVYQPVPGNFGRFLVDLDDLHIRRKKGMTPIRQPEVDRSADDDDDIRAFHRLPPAEFKQP